MSTTSDAASSLALNVLLKVKTSRLSKLSNWFFLFLPTFPKTFSGSNFDQKKIDSILDKISESGYESLTKEEKNYLFKASNKKK